MFRVQHRATISKTCVRCGQRFEARDKRARFCPGACYLAHEAEGSRRRRAQWSDERRRAVVATGCAIQSGKLVRQPCEVCGKTSYVDAHHDDYSRPLDVRWLCRSHHRQHHIAEAKRQTEAA